MCALDPFIDNFNYEDDSSFDKRRYIDAIQYSIKSFIGNSYLLWLCLILFLNGKDWKRPVIFILVLYWFLYSTSNLFLSYINYTNIIDFGVKGYDWPYTKRYWLFTNALPDLFLISGEIIADWYLFLRTKALIINKRKLKPIYITCIIYNIIKLIQIICNFLLTPSTFKRQEDKANTEILRYKIVWWSIILIIQLVSLIYDTFVILALKNNLFNKLEGFKNNSNNFMEKFKQISEYRIFISIFCSIILFPLAFIHLYIYIIWYKDPYKDFEDNSYLVEILRIDGLNFTYTFMYIDQFLLRFYINKIMQPIPVNYQWMIILMIH